MGRSRQVGRKKRPFEEAFAQLRQHYLLGSVAREVTLHARPASTTAWRPGAVCRIESDATIAVNEGAPLSLAQWLGALTIATLVLALGAPRRLAVPSPLADLAAQLAALHWWRMLKLGVLPERMEIAPEWLQWGRLPLVEIVARLESEPEHELQDGRWTLNASLDEPLLVSATAVYRYAYGTLPTRDLEQVFAQAMVDNAKRALQAQHEAGHAPREGANPNSAAARAKRWLVAHYPLLGGLLTQFELVEDVVACRSLDISIAAIHVGAGEIYINPARGLDFEQCKFVVAHEVLHAGLCHSSRRNGRDAYLWNVACDFVINDWLVTMQVGTPPETSTCAWPPTCACAAACAPCAAPMSTCWTSARTAVSPTARSSAAARWPRAWITTRAVAVACCPRALSRRSARWPSRRSRGRRRWPSGCASASR